MIGIPKITDFTDEQLAEAGAKFLNRQPSDLLQLIQSPAGQAVLSNLRNRESEPPTVLVRCPECEFGFETPVL